MARNLLMVPTVHVDDDSMSRLFLDDPDMAEQAIKLEQANQVAQNYWKFIKVKVLGFDLDYNKVRVFSEGLTNSPEFQALQKKLKEAALEMRDYTNEDAPGIYNLVERNLQNSLIANSPQSELLLYLVLRGAEVSFAENEGLHNRAGKLFREYNDALLGDGLDSEFTQEELLDMREISKDFEETQDQRDKYAAGVINKELADDETGIAIWGASHDFSKYLDSDVNVRDFASGIKEAMPEWALKESTLCYKNVKKITDDIAKEMGIELDDFNPTSLEGRG